MKLKVYIAGPYTQGDTEANLQKAIMVTSLLLDLGYHPYCPHLTHYIHLHKPRAYEDWMDLDFAYLRVCNILLRLPGKSPGADREVALAKELGIPVCYGIGELLGYPLWKDMPPLDIVGGD